MTDFNGREFDTEIDQSQLEGRIEGKKMEMERPRLLKVKMPL